VIEAEPEDSPAEAGLEQAKAYAKDLGLAFAYVTNGHRILEYDFSFIRQGSSKAFLGRGSSGTVGE